MGPEDCWSKKICAKKIGQKELVKKNLVQTNLIQQFWIQNISSPKDFRFKKIWSKKI